MSWRERQSMATQRRVSLVLADGSGELLGVLPAITVDDPWWPEVQPVIAAAPERPQASRRPPSRVVPPG